MNDWSDEKCYDFGQRIKSEFKGKWSDFLKYHRWIEFKGKNYLTDRQVHYVRRGFSNQPFVDHTHDWKRGHEYDDEIMPFGKFKGQTFVSLPYWYIEFLHTWKPVYKWPLIAEYVQAVIKNRDEQKLSKEEIKQLLKLEK